MRNVRVRHNEAIAAHTGDAASPGSAAVDRHAFANHIVVPDFKARLFAFEFQILRFESERREGKDAIIVSDSCWAAQHYVGDKFAVLAHYHVVVHNAKWANNAAFRNLCVGVDDSSRMNANAHAGRLTN